MRNDAEPITASVTHHGEGPFWDAHRGRLLCMDVLQGAVVDIDPQGKLARYQLPCQVATAIRHRVSGGFVIATEDGLIGADDKFSRFHQIANLGLGQGLRTNDGGCDPLGSFIIGTMAYDGREGAGAVYRVTPDHRVAKVLSPVSISNGVQWTADGTRAYYIDTPTRTVDAFDVDLQTGAWTGRHAHIQIDDTPGLPDGMAIDEDDGVWVALWGGGGVNHYDASGRFVQKVTVPGVTQISSCAFGGRDRSVLYITTSRQGLPDNCESDAGAIFAVQTGSRGAVPMQFAG